VSAPKLTEAQRRALTHIESTYKGQHTWGHPSWVSDVMFDLVDAGFLAEERVDGGRRLQLTITDAGRAALRGK